MGEWLTFALWETGRMMASYRSRGGIWEETSKERETESPMVGTPFRKKTQGELLNSHLPVGTPSSGSGVGLGRWLQRTNTVEFLLKH